jgi:hypothetical protein
MKSTKLNSQFLCEVSFDEKEILVKIGILISKKQAKFSHYASDKLFYILDVSL